MEVSQRVIGELIQTKLNKLKQKNSLVSLRSLANKLNISSGALSEIIRNKRKISRKLALRIAEILEFSAEDRKRFLEPFDIQEQLRVQKSYESKTISKDTINPDDYWLALYLLNKLSEARNVNDVVENQNLIDVDNLKISRIIERLLENGIVNVNQGGMLAKSHRDFLIEKHQIADFVKASLSKDLELVSKIDLYDRILGIEMAVINIEEEKIEELEVFLSDVRRRIELMFNSHSNERTIKVSLITIPLSKNK